MRVKPFTLVLLSAAVVAAILNWEKINSFLEYFGLGIGVIALYFFNKYFDKKVDQALAWIKDKLGFARQPSKGIEVSHNSKRYERFLESLKGKVQSLCQGNINRISEGDLKLIEKLNWRIFSKSQKRSFKGTLYEAVKHTQGDRLLSFAVIGEAGVGKTSAIYSFILDLILKNPDDLVPVYFSLSSWKRNQSLEEWLIKELSRLYHLDKRAAQYFIKDFRIFPFLDGLDQMTQEMREKCILQIFEYSKNNPIGLTSRPLVFGEMVEHLKKNDVSTDYLFDVFELLPLTSEQVNDITATMASKDTFKNVFQKSNKIKGFARYPMALFILSNIIDQLTANEIEAIDQSADDSVFDLLWKKYDAHIFADKNFLAQRNIRTDPIKMRNWLKRLSFEKDSSFYIEELQPAFLSGKDALFKYYFLSRVVQCVFITIAAGLFMAGPFDLLSAGILSGIVAFSVVLASKSQRIGEVSEQSKTDSNKVMAYFKGILVHLLPLLPFMCLYFGFSTPRNPEIPGEMRLNNTFSMTELNVGFLMSVLIALILGNRYSWQTHRLDIRLVERISRDWRKFFKYGVIGGISLGIFLVPMTYALMTYLGDSGFGIWLGGQSYFSNPYSMAFMVGLLFGFCLFGIIGYLKEQSILIDKEEKKRIFTPNYGIRQTFMNALKAGVSVTVILIFFYGGFIYILEGEMTSLIKAFKTSMAFGVLGFLWFGGLDVIGHYCLRFITYLDNSGPLNYIRFLEEASSLRYIRINGSGYEFMHPTVKEYFSNAHFQDIGQNKMKKLSIPLLAILLLFSVASGLYDRFYGDTFWKSELFGLVIESHTPYAREVNDAKIKLVVQGLDSAQTLTLKFDAKGKVKVGTFTGYVDAGGTEGGFFGMGIEDIYDKKPKLQHGVLAVKKTTEDQWRGFPDTDMYDLFSDSKPLFLRVNNQDSLEFLINDTEYHNNGGRLFLSIDSIQTKNSMQIISHRGAAGLAPENTLASIKKGMALNADKIEIDIHMTKDGHLVVLHDKKINRTTNGRGKVSDLNLDELKKYTINDELSGAEVHKIPTLAEVFALVKDTDSKLLVEVKSPESYDGIDVRLFDLIEKFNMVDKVEVFSFDKDFTVNFKKAHPNIFVGRFLVSPFGADKIQGVDAVGIYYHSLLFKKSFLAHMQKKDIAVYAWSVNTQRAMQRLIELGIDGIITDRPDVLRTTLGY